MTDEKQPAQQSMPAPILEKTIADSVLNKIRVFEETGQIDIPKNYSAANALKAAWLIILETVNRDKKPALEVCTKDSVANALLKMIVLGLNPVKKQCAFIVYGNQLSCDVEYQGNVAMAKRTGLKNIRGIAVFEKDIFKYTVNPNTGVKTVTEHTQTMESLDSPIKGAYAVKEYEGNRFEAEIMTMAQIRKAWEQGPMKGKSPAHINFPDQMAIKTVINRALKPDIHSSDDSAFMDDEETNFKSLKSSQLAEEIRENGNKKEIGFTEHEVVTPVKEMERVPVKKAEDKPVQAEMQMDEEGPNF